MRVVMMKMFRLAAVPLLLGLAGFPARADDKDSSRLPEDTSVAKTPAAAWSVLKDTSKIDDSLNVYSTAGANHPVYDRFGRSYMLSAHVVCRENSTHFYFNFDGLFVADSGGFGIITLRADKDKARQISTRGSTDHQALGLWSGEGNSLLKSLLGKQSLLLVATPYSESSVDATFDMSGFEAALREIRQACHW